MSTSTPGATRPDRSHRRRRTQLAAALVSLAASCVVWAAWRSPERQETALPAHTNHLIHETSPYLLMHAHNPVDWYPWGDEAFDKARRENKPIFLSVGYATCYWCHVMERESFENETVAAVLNRGFVSIKVDREERPDVDELYMLAVQLVTGQGGWPMSVWLTPDLKPFYGGTYFPPDDRHGRPGFTTLLERISELWQHERPALDGQAEQLAKAIGDHSSAGAGGRLGREVVDRAVQSILRRADSRHGGSAGAPKFPPDIDCAFLLAVYRRTHDPKLLAHVALTLDQMAIGGLWDHLGGGFHRYSVDESWTVPHFEKMLYNQAGLLRLYAEAAVLTGKPLYRRVAEEIAEFVRHDMTDPELGAFYSALDAETEGEEGRSYVWSREEATTALGGEGELFRRLYGLDGQANFEHGRHVLRLARPLADTDQEMHLTEEQLLAKLEPARAKLLAARDRRPQPITDDKVLTSWNGLMIGTLAHAGMVLGNPGMVAQAKRAAEAVLAKLDTPETGLLRVWRKGVAKQPAFLDDYAALADGLLDLAEATGDAAWRTRAEGLADAMLQRFAAPGGGFYYTPAGDHELFVRSRNPYDNALPSGASSAAETLFRLAAATGRDDLRRHATATLDSLASFVENSPSGFTNLLRVAEEHTSAAAPPPAATDSAAHVHLSARRTKTGIEVRLKVDAGWHIYAHDIGMYDVIPTEVTVPGGEPEYPAARSTSPLPGGLAVAVYEGDVVIPVRLGGSTGPVSVEVAVQACNDHACLKPSTLRCELP